MIYAVALWLAGVLIWAYWPQIRNARRTWRWWRLKRRIENFRSTINR